mmetsp:Transcript_19160/g.39398  ORF Transcript_19160/g.39398 Transcript_19160/m.39398 type:complete len:518 (+) Transcript_19160:115-1668(+)
MMIRCSPRRATAAAAARTASFGRVSTRADVDTHTHTYTTVARKDRVRLPLRWTTNTPATTRTTFATTIAIRTITTVANEHLIASAATAAVPSLVLVANDDFDRRKGRQQQRQQKHSRKSSSWRSITTGWEVGVDNNKNNINSNKIIFSQSMRTTIQDYNRKRAFRATINTTTRSFSNNGDDNANDNDAAFQGTVTTASTPLDVEAFQSNLLSKIPEMARSLSEHGYYTTTTTTSENNNENDSNNNTTILLPESTVRTLREQSVALRLLGRFEQSYSETIDEATGVVIERFDKEGVFACEPDGKDYYDATDLVTYMSVLLQTLPAALNENWQQEPTELQTPCNMPTPTLSSESFNAKLAVTEHGGAKYPLHVDNPQGLAVGDTRKLTCILYLNPDYAEGDGGAIRLYLPTTTTIDNNTKNNDNDSGNANNDNDNDFLQGLVRTVDLSPVGGRLLVFWSDEIPHEVLPTSSSLQSMPPNSADKDRYALTLWIPTSNVDALHNESSKFSRLKDLVFARNL